MSNIHGWQVLGHSCFVNQFENLVLKVRKLKEKYPETYQQKNSTKMLEAIENLAFDIIPQDPTRSSYRQGLTLGAENKYWFRAKFYQQYRLFFRYRLEDKIIVMGWVNDDKTKRAYGSKSDAYKVFESMLGKGTPPNDWNKLLVDAETQRDRLKQIREQM